MRPATASGAVSRSIWVAVDALSERHTRDQSRAVIVMEVCSLADDEFAAFVRRMHGAVSSTKDHTLRAQYWLTLADILKNRPVLMAPYIDALSALALQHLSTSKELGKHFALLPKGPL